MLFDMKKGRQGASSLSEESRREKAKGPFLCHTSIGLGYLHLAHKRLDQSWLSSRYQLSHDGQDNDLCVLDATTADFPLQGGAAQDFPGGSAMSPIFEKRHLVGIWRGSVSVATARSAIRVTIEADTMMIPSKRPPGRRLNFQSACHKSAPTSQPVMAFNLIGILSI